MVMWSRLSIVAPLVALLLAGCAGAIYEDEENPSLGKFSNRLIGAAGADGSVATIIDGTPFQSGDQTLETAVTAAMKGSYRGPLVDFEVPEIRPVSGYRVVLAFNRAPGTSLRLCRGGALSGQGAQNGTLHMAFCLGTKRVASVWGIVPEAASSEDPRFGQFIADMTNELLSPANRNGNGNAIIIGSL